MPMIVMNFRVSFSVFSSLSDYRDMKSVVRYNGFPSMGEIDNDALLNWGKKGDKPIDSKYGDARVEQC